MALEQLRIFVAVAEPARHTRPATSQSDPMGDERRNRRARGALRDEAVRSGWAPDRAEAGRLFLTEA